MDCLLSQCPHRLTSLSFQTPNKAQNTFNSLLLHPSHLPPKPFSSVSFSIQAIHPLLNSKPPNARNQSLSARNQFHGARNPFLSSRNNKFRQRPRFQKGVRASFVEEAISAVQSSPSSFSTAVLVNVLIFVLGAPVLLSGLTVPAMATAFVLGTATWQAFGGGGFAIVALYFVLGTAVTKVRMKQKQAEGIAEKRSGRRGPGSVIGSGTAGFLCAFFASLPFGYFENESIKMLLRLGFVASFSTKLSDTSASEIGKAYGKTTYLVTSFEKVPRGTEGAVSWEGTVAGILASLLLTSMAVALGQVDLLGALFCLLASQIANYGESIVGATLQDKPGYEWMTNDVVNVLNIGLGCGIAIFLRALFS